jgi:hypothetical protein
MIEPTVAALPRHEIEVLEEFRGTIDRVLDGVVYATLTDTKQRELAVKYSLDFLSSQGLTMDEDFELIIRRSNGVAERKYIPVPKCKVKPEKWETMLQEIREDIGDV